MVLGAILGAGLGTRIKEFDIPKQFVLIENRPVIAYSMDSFYNSGLFDKIFVVVNREWKEYLVPFINSEYNDPDRFEIVEGGNSRLNSYFNLIDHMRNKYLLNKENCQTEHTPFFWSVLNFVKLHSCINT